MKMSIYKYPIQILTMSVQQTKTIQFLIIGKNVKGKDFDERVDCKFEPTATPADVAQKRTDLKSIYESKGFTVEVYTVSPNLQVNIA
jgi:hypothetical protein